MKVIDLEKSNLSLFNHRDIDQIEDNFQAVIETEILIPSERPAEKVIIQDCYNEKSEYKRDAFYHSNDIGCREIPLLR